MSSLRNVVHRRPHKERSQPQERSKWGLLEKHKDYSLRAKDYNEKKAKLKILRQKASERNTDEFHFAMMSHRFEDGSKRLRKSELAGMAHAKSQLLKTQDAGYLRTMIQSTQRARKRLAEDLALQRAQNDLGETGEEDASGVKGRARAHSSSYAKHIVFVDDRTEQKAYEPSPRNPSSRSCQKQRLEDENDLDDHEGQLDAEMNLGQSTKAFIEELNRGPLQQKTIKSQERKLEALRLREKALIEAEQELELQRARMNNSLGGVTRAGHRFKIKGRKK